MKGITVTIICIYAALNSLGVESRRHGGKDDSQGKIIGGQHIHIETVPYQAALVSYHRLLCGGSLISPTFVLTAAHCLLGKYPQSMQVRLGSAEYGNGGMVIPVKQILINENYRRHTKDSDIGLVEMLQAVNESRTIRIIPLADREPAPGQTILATGWGAERTDVRHPAFYLRYALMPVVDRKICHNQYLRVPINVTHNMFCAGYMGGGIGTCFGDSGGPGTIDNTLYGVIFGGAECAAAGFPGLYTDVHRFRAWIKAHVHDLPE